MTLRMKLKSYKNKQNLNKLQQMDLQQTFKNYRKIFKSIKISQKRLNQILNKKTNKLKKKRRDLKFRQNIKMSINKL